MESHRGIIMSPQVESYCDIIMSPKLIPTVVLSLFPLRWALTMLSTRNVGWASTCNTVGQTIGYFFGYLGFLALDSPMFCNLFRVEELDVGCVSMEVGIYFYFLWEKKCLLSSPFIILWENSIFALYMRHPLPLMFLNGIHERSQKNNSSPF